MKINSFRWLAAAIVLTASGTVSTASPVPVVVDYENVVNGDTTVTAVGISWTLTGDLGDVLIDGYGAPAAGTASPGSNGYMDTGLGVSHPLGNLGGLKAPTGATFRAASFDVWPSQDGGDNIYGGSGNVLGTTGLNYELVGLKGGHQVVSATVTDTPRTPPQSGPATGYWHHIDLSATAFATADIDTIEFVLVAQTGAAMNYLAVDNVAYFDYAAPAAAPQVTWTPPPPIIYGAALTTNQLNASAMVAGSVAYLPDVGTVLNTGSNTLTAIFTPADLLDYRLVTNTVVQTVLPAVLTVKANNASRAFGQANPAFTGTITGVTNGDNITASYGTPATPGTPVGTHPIVPGLVDPANRQTNYTVTLIDGTLTINAVETPSLVVTMTNDVVDPYDNQTSLREALAYAQTLGRTPTITFSNTLAGQTVILTNIGDGTFGPSALLVSNVAVVIDGGTNAVTLSQGIGTNSLTGGMRIFYVAASGNLTLKNLTVSGGLAQGGGCDYGGGAAGLGGAVVNAGTLQLVQCTFTANQALGGNCNSNNIDALDAGGGLGGNGDASSGDGGPPNGGLGLGGNGGFGGGGGMLGGFGGFGGGGGGGGLGGLGGFGAGSGSDLGGGGFGGGGGGGFGGAGLGGAVFNYGGAVAIANATLAGNVARGGLGVSNGSGYGGAIFNLNGSVSALNATIVGNTAPQGGGAIYNLGDNGVATQAGPVLPSAPASVTLTNTILAGSSDGSARPVSDYLQYTNNSGNGGGFGSVTSGGANNLIVSNAVNQAFAGGILSSANPLLGPLASNGGPTPTMALLPGSPAITAGSLTAVAGLPTDQRGAGYPRVVNGQVGLGAYEIQTVPAVITWTNPAAIVYGTAVSASQLNATPNVAGTFAYEPANGTVLTTGTNLLTVIFTPADATYYTGATNQVELVVLPAPLTVTAADASRVYDQFNPPFNGTLVGLTNGDVISAAYASGALTNTPAGIYRNAIVPTLVDPANLATNYAVTLVAGTLTITPAPTVISWTNPANPAAIVYGTALGANQLNATANVAGAFTYIPAAGTVLTTGVKTLTSIFTPTDTTDYTGFTNQVSLVVLPAPLTVTAANASRYYNTPNPVFSGAIVGLTNGDIITATYASGTLTNTPAGIYSNSLVPTLVDPNHLATNYSVTLVAGALTVLSATPVITWTYPANPAPIVYGAALGTSQLNATANVAGTFTYVPAAGTVLTTGTKTLTSIFTPTDTADYSVATNQVSLVVLPAPLTVTAANASRYYNNPNPVFTGAIVGLTNGDIITASYASGALTNTPAGVYSNSIVPTLVDPAHLATNYTVTLVAGTLTITPAPTVITWTYPANPASIVYGTALGASQLNATANVAGSFTYVPAAGTVLTTGTNTLAAIFTPADTTDYTEVTNQASLVVLPAPLMVTAANASRYYNTPNPVFSGTLTGLTNGDVITAACASSTLPNTPAGVYSNSIVPTLVDPAHLATNYTVTLVAGTLAITPAPTLVAWTYPANPAAIVYGTALGTNQLDATANVAGAFTYIPAAGTVLTTGTKTLASIFTPTDTTDYTGVTNQVSLMVLPAPLTVTAANASRYYNTPNPVFTGAIMGLTNGDVITVTCTSSALTNTPAGVYSNSIVPTLIDPNNLATNYSITLVAGTLTVFLTTPVISWTNPANPAAIVYGTALGTNQLNATANVAGSFTYIPAAGTVLTTGTKTLTDIFTPADTTDYSVTTNQFSLVVLPAPLTVTAANASRYYPTTNNPVFSGTIVGLTNGDVITATYASSALPNTPAGVYSNSIVPTLVDPHNLATNYAVTLVAGALTILKASLIITWTNPAVIAYAVPLDTNQLNATANVPGSFAYIPPGGTVLPVGTNTLTTMFTPADKADYNDATSQVSQVVVRLGISAAPVTLDFLTGLYEQSVQVTNPGATLGGIELLVSNLTSRVSLYNAAGTNAGLPYAQFAVALPTGASQTFILQFLNPYRTNITDAVYCIAIVPPPPRLNGTTGLLITQVKINTVVAGSPRFTLAFPSTAGQSYEVLYSDDNLSSWRVADTLTATSTFTIWTELLPPAAICRFFKVIITPSPN